MNPATAFPRPDPDRAIGITTTVPVEIIFAAGFRPIDLNNIFINSGAASEMVAEAERRGFPRNSCAWSKGVYAAALRRGLRRVVAVVQGDCANTQAISEMLAADGLEVIPFSYPYRPDDFEVLEMNLRRLADALSASLDEAERWKRRLDELRDLARRVDELCWMEGRASGDEQRRWTISCSDFLCDPERFAAEAGAAVRACESREPARPMLRLALLGIPPICENFFSFLEQRGARVVFNEIPRQFSMPYRTATLREQYSRYTYPYDIFYRLADVAPELLRRRVDAVVHYVQSFCFRQVQDSLVRREISLPILTLECDRPGPLDKRTETRIEAFLEMLQKGRSA